MSKSARRISYLLSMEGVTASPNLATGLGAVLFFSKSALRWLMESMAGSTLSTVSSSPSPSNIDLFWLILLLEAVSMLEEPSSNNLGFGGGGGGGAC